MSVDMPNLVDSATRSAAVSSFEENLVILAGAGTGKTSLLVERMLNALGSGLATMEEIVAITFTERAASEMRTRLAAGLEELLRLADGNESPPKTSDEAGRSWLWLSGEGEANAEQVRKRTLAALSKIDRAQVVTIHTFCSSLLRAYPIEAGVDPRFEIDRGEHYTRIREEEWERFVADQLADHKQLPIWETVLATVGLDDIREVAFGLSGFDVPEMILADPGRSFDARELFREELDRLLPALRSLLNRRLPEGEYKGRTTLALPTLATLIPGLEALQEGGLDGYLQYVETNPDMRDLTDRKNPYKPSHTNQFREVDQEELKSVISDATRLAQAPFQCNEETSKQILCMAAGFAYRARNSLLQQGFVNFDGLLRLARDLLRDHPKIRESIRTGIRLLLVDEFQDTDPIQYEITLFLSEKAGGSVTDPYHTELQAGRLFVVGDAKQSIYRFRGADYTAFDRAVQYIRKQGGRQLDLTTNFRTVREILDPVNRLFKERRGGTWRPSFYQPEYVPIEPYPERTAGELRVELWKTSDGEAMQVGRRRRAEAEAIAQEIDDILTARGPKALNEIMILIRAFATLPPYLRALRQRNIPYVVDGGKGFMARPEVSSFIATARAVVRPSDQAALLAFLRSPGGGISDQQLAEYARDGGLWDRHQMDQPCLNSHDTIRNAFQKLNNMAQNASHQPADEAVRTILEMSGLITCSALSFEGSQRVANLHKLQVLATELGRDGRFSLAELLDLLEDEQVTQSDTESPMADENTEAVRILSIHKAKGLESGTVIIPDLARVPQGPRAHSFRITHLDDGTPVPCLKLHDICNLAFHRHRLVERQHEEAENIRLLYVAVTRPKDRLIVISGKSRGKAPWVEALSSWIGNSVADVIQRPIEEPATTASVSVQGSTREAGGMVQAYESACRGLDKRVSRPFRAPSAHDEERFAVHEDPDTLPRSGGTDRDEAKALGTAVHQALENWDPEKGDPVSDHSEAKKMLRDFATGPLGKQFREIKIIGREVPMLLNDEDGFTWRGSIDLLYEDNGTLVVADYKTDATLTPEHRENYRKQLKRYAEAVTKVTGKPVRTELWMVRTGEIVTF